MHTTQLYYFSLCVISDYQSCSHFPTMSSDLFIWAKFSNAFIMWWEKAASWLACVDSMGDAGFGNWFIFKLMKKTCYALLTCTMALGGASVGVIVGAIKGQSRETGFVGGAGMGAMVGAVSAVQFLDLMVNGEPFSKVALVHNLLNGKVFMEWINSALLEAYQWQISNLEASFNVNSDIFEINGTKGLSKVIIKRLPTSRFCPNKKEIPCQPVNCIICLEEYNKGEFTRMLPRCGHTFHKNCIDVWLTRHGSCPICRREI